jgi:hypothetical protein
MLLKLIPSPLKAEVSSEGSDASIQNFDDEFTRLRIYLNGKHSFYLQKWIDLRFVFDFLSFETTKLPSFVFSLCCFHLFESLGVRILHHWPHRHFAQAMSRPMRWIGQEVLPLPSRCIGVCLTSLNPMWLTRYKALEGHHPEAVGQIVDPSAVLEEILVGIKGEGEVGEIMISNQSMRLVSEERWLDREREEEEGSVVLHFSSGNK